MLKARLGVPLILVLASCSSFGEVHYFKSQGDVPNFYRLRVSGSSLFSSSRYVSGYFDEEAVNAYFNEFTQPTKGRLTPTSGTKITPLAAAAKNKAFVMILSTNADAIATQIGGLAEDADVLKAVTRIAQRGDIKDAARAVSSLAVQKQKGTLLASLAEQMVAAVEASPSGADAEAAVVSFLNAYARMHGHTGSFTDISDAENWFASARPSILGGQQ